MTDVTNSEFGPGVPDFEGDQPRDRGLVAKLAHCQAFEESPGVQGCAFLLRGGVCGYQRLREGPRRGQFPSLAEIERCPRREAGGQTK